MGSLVRSPEYWLPIVAVMGAIVGSFLNVVIYRLPRGLSVLKPRWSFCPKCEKPVRAYDNLPIIGWLLLKGRCRDCHAPIGVVYPLIECATAFLCVMVWDALFIGNTAWSADAVLSRDWSMGLAYLTLFTSLFAMSAMDVESYTIDIRTSIVAMVAGVLFHGMWGASVPTGPAEALPVSLSVIGVAMGIAWLATIGVARCFGVLPGAAEGGEEAEETPEEESAYLTGDGRFRPWPILLFVGVIAAMVVWQLSGDGRALERGGVAVGVLFVLLIAASMVERESDSQIVEEIEAERHEARSVALREFLWLAPSLMVGVGLLIWFQRSERLPLNLQGLFAFDFGATFGGILQGVLRATAAMVLGAAVGWGVRILGTLSFGKEALGTGDIYILAAMGAVLGFWGALIPFFLAAFLALLGWVVLAFRKRSRAVAFGPWLALASVAYLWCNGKLLEAFGLMGHFAWSKLTGIPIELLRL